MIIIIIIAMSIGNITLQQYNKNKINEDDNSNNNTGITAIILAIELIMIDHIIKIMIIKLTAIINK